MSSIIRADRWQDSNGVAYNSVLQVVSTSKTDAFSTTSTSFTDVTGLSVSITPRFSTSRILVAGYVTFGTSGDLQANVRLVRDSTGVFVGDTASSRPRGFALMSINNLAQSLPASPIFLDSPNTASAITYKIQIMVNSGTAFVNRTSLDRDTTLFDGRTTSSITVMEIAQ
jgi:hypothetical protein